MSISTPNLKSIVPAWVGAGDLVRGSLLRCLQVSVPLTSVCTPSGAPAGFRELGRGWKAQGTGQGPSEARPVPGRLEEPCCCQEDGAGGSPRPGRKLLALQGGWGHAAPLHRPWVCFQGPGSCGLGSGRVASTLRGSSCRCIRSSGLLRGF